MKKVFYISLAYFLTAKAVVATGPIKDLSGMRKQADALSNSAGFASASYGSVTDIISTVIKAFLGLLGIIFIILIIWAGYNWMTAAGNEEKVTKAKKTLYQAIIGLLITISAYAITYFVFNALDKSTSTL